MKRPAGCTYRLTFRQLGGFLCTVPSPVLGISLLAHSLPNIGFHRFLEASQFCL